MIYDLTSLSYSESCQLTDELVKVLGRDDVRCFSQCKLISDWFEFCSQPSKYAETIVVDMVNEYLDCEFERIKNHSDKTTEGAQFVMLSEVD